MTSEIHPDLLRHLEAGYSLPSLSVVVIRLVELASDERCSVNDIAGLIEKDPSLTVRLLKLANSAFFRGSQPVVTLKHAILRIGFRQLRIMALSLSLRDTFPMGKVGVLDYERFWRTSLYRALLAKSFAHHLGTCDPEEAFVGGLTLGVGFLIFFDLFVKGKGVDMDSGLDTLDKLLAWETERFGVDHRKIGRAVLRYWGFPEEIVDCQLGYKGGTTGPLARVCESARVLSNILLRRSAGFHSLFREGNEKLGLSDETINDIVLATFEEVQDIAESFRIEMNKEKDLLELMEKANRALSQISEKMSHLQQEGSLPSFEGLSGEQTAGQTYVNETLQAVAHEIRNPLVAVAGFAKRLAATVDPLSKGGEYARIILEEAVRLETALTEMTRDRLAKNTG